MHERWVMESSTAALRSARHIARAALVRYPVEFALALPASFRAHAALLLVTLVYWISGIIIGSIAGLPLASTITTYAGVLIVIVPAALLGLIGLRGIDIMAPADAARAGNPGFVGNTAASGACLSDAAGNANLRWNIHDNQGIHPLPVAIHLGPPF